MVHSKQKRERKSNFTFIASPNVDEHLDETLSDCEPCLIKRKHFPKEFVFGAAGSAYQYEGGATDGGRGPSTWDTFTLTRPDKIEDGSNGSVAINQYHLYKDDVKLAKKTGLDAYRFSISWSRILPGGKLSAGINKEGIKYYNDLIDSLLAEDIQPYVTLFHWDLPQALEHEYGGFLSHKIVQDFCDFAEVCFWEFGDRVKHWITINEAWTYTFKGYVNGTFPPARGSTEVEAQTTHQIGYKGSWKKHACTHGHPGKEPYVVAHHFILAHAKAVDLYRKQFQTYQGGEIGMTNNVNWYEPLNPYCEEDKKAALRAVDFMFGWFVAPLVTGDYPQSMRERVGIRLPQFKSEEVLLVKDSYDFLGVNYYTTYYATNSPKQSGTPTYENDQELTSMPTRSGVPIGIQGGSSWLYVVPRGIYELLTFMKREYRNPLIYITENGVDELNNPKLTLSEARLDPIRVKYHHDHLCFVKKAISEHVNVKAYFIWSLIDNFEWAEGYTVRFGIYYIDFVNGRLTRYPKSSAIWWTNFLNNKFIRTSLKRQAQESEGKHESSKKPRIKNV